MPNLGIDIGADVIIDALLGSDTNEEIVEAVRNRLEIIVLPWRTDGSMPPKFIRETALGVQLGIVDPWLGGYARPHQPEVSRIGWRATTPSGQGACDSGVVKVETAEAGFVVPTIEEGRTSAFARAKEKVDIFINLELHGYTLLEETEE